MATHTAALVAITFGAAVVNGALGYGFSSITVPLALLFLSNRALNPALVLPVGAVVIRHVRSETFRRVCMSFDAWLLYRFFSAVPPAVVTHAA